MTNAVAVIGLTFDDVDVQDADFGLFLELVRGLNEGPEVRGTDTVVPGMIGRVARNRVADRWVIELRGIVGPGDGGEDGDLAAFRTNVNRVRALFDQTAAPAALVASLEDGTTATIVARTLNTVWDQVAPELARISIELEAVGGGWTIV